MQSENISPNLELECYKKSLNYAKTTIAAGANMTNDKITSERNVDYIKKNIIKK